MKRIILILAVVFTCPSIFAAPPFVEATADTLVQEALRAWQVPGAAVVVVTRDRTLYLKGHGVRELGRPEPIDADTVFPLASCSKAFTSLLISQLADEGRLSWDEPVRRHLPHFHLADPLADAGVALRDLLCHRTGVAQHDFLWYHSPLPQAEIVRRAAFLPPSRPFRTAFQYQSTMATAAGIAAGNAGGKPWDVLMRERIFDPLGMRSTTLVTPPPQSNRAMPHRPNGNGTLVPIPWYEQNEPNAACSIHTSARDLGNWLAFQMGDGAFLGRRLVSPQGLAETHTPQIPQHLEGLDQAMYADTTMMSYGLGWVIHDYRGYLVWAHTGLIDGFRVQIAIVPQAGIAVGVLSNRFETRMNLALVNNFVDRLLGLPTKDWNTYLGQLMATQEQAIITERLARERQRDPAGKPARPLTDFVGQYEHPAYGVIEVRLDGAQLIWVWNKFSVPMRYFRGLEFDLPNPDLRDPSTVFIDRGGAIIGCRMFDVEFRRR